MKTEGRKKEREEGRKEEGREEGKGRVSNSTWKQASNVI